MPSLKEIVFNHYRDATLHRTEAQLEREKWLIPNVVPFNRWLLFPAALIIQLCCGSLYAWSGYNGPIETAIYGPNGLVDRAMAVNTFYIAVAVFGCTAAILGPWLERNGPFRGAILGAVLFYAGNLIAAAGVQFQQISVVYIGYGLIGGAGLGVAYIAPVSPLQKWFPEIRGLAAGVAVCGFGGGSIIAPYTQKALIGPEYAKLGNPGKNFGVPLTFVILGSIYFGLMTLSALVLRMPPPGYSINGITIDTVKGAEAVKKNAETTVSTETLAWKTVDDSKRVSMSDQGMVESGVIVTRIQSSDAVLAMEDTDKPMFAMSLWESLTSFEYLCMYMMFFGSQVTGLLIISKIQQITITQMDKSTDEAALINSLLGGANLLGRILLPLISDLVKTRKTLFVISTGVQVILLGVLPTIIAAQSFSAFLVAVNLIAFFYGGGFGIIPAFLADQFGSKNVGATHGVILTAWAIAGVCGGLIFTTVYDSELKKVYNAATKRYMPPDAKLHVYDLNFRWILAFVLMGLIMAILVPAHLRDRKLPHVEGEIFRVRIFGKLVRCIKGKGFVVVSKEQERSEWEKYMISM